MLSICRTFRWCKCVVRPVVWIHVVSVRGLMKAGYAMSKKNARGWPSLQEREDDKRVIVVAKLSSWIMAVITSSKWHSK